MGNIKTICVRFNLDKPIHKRAYDYLQLQTDFASNSPAIATALVDYFDWHKRENRLIEKFGSMLDNRSTSVVTAVTPTVAENQADDIDEVEIDFDFLGG